MAERTKYAPGTFSWTDLSTTDQEGAKQFYGELFGWDADDKPVGDGMMYSMMNIGGKPVAGISPQNEMQRQSGAPPAWNSYVTVESADDVGGPRHEARRQRDRATVRRDGRRADGRDPGSAGRVLHGLGAQAAHRRLDRQRPRRAVLERARDHGSRRLGRLLPRAVRVAGRAVRGHGVPVPGHPERRRSNGGMRPSAGERADVLARVLRHRRHRRLAGEGDRARRHHAVGPMDIGMGKIGVLQDPQGAVFALFAGDFDG